MSAVATLKVLTLYPLASGGTPRAGTIGLRFGAAGAAVFTTGKVGPAGDLAAGDVCTITAIAGEFLETGLLFSVTTLPAGSLGAVGR